MDENFECYFNETNNIKPKQIKKVDLKALARSVCSLNL